MEAGSTASNHSVSSASAQPWLEPIGSFFLPPYGQPAHITDSGNRYTFYLSLATEKRKTQRRSDKMADKNTQDYSDDNTEGYVDAREANFKCENPDRNLGCDLGIDVMG